jgi:hypothetical protein
MPLPKPSLDSRRFDPLVEEARAQIPRLAARWTDHNASDPGITLLELCAWLAEQDFYRFDRPSDEALAGFARLLLDDEPHPAGVARAVVAIDDPNGAGFDLPARIQLDDRVGPVFETTGALFVSPARLVALGCAPAGSATGTADLLPANQALQAWWPFGARPRPGAALVLGFDRALDAPGRTLSLAVWTEQHAADAAVRAALQAEQPAAGALCCGGAAGPPDWRAHYRVQTVWEYDAGGHWQPLAEVVDETRACSLSGFVRFRAPVGHQALDGLFRLRCRICRGRFECPPRLQHLAFNAVEAEHAVTQGPIELGSSRGHAGVRYGLGVAPVVAGSVELLLDDGLGDLQTDWQVVQRWDRIGAHDRCLRLDAERGELEAGDGWRGEVPPAGFALRATCRSGSGAAGNLAAGALLAVSANAHNDGLTQPQPVSALALPLQVWQPFAAAGGGAAETLADYQARAYEAAVRVDKAVTLEDFERLALATPGVPLARAHAVAGWHPLLPCVPAPGVVTLIVLPRCGRPVPLPSAALLQAVARHLAPRRLVTSEPLVIAPRYRRLAVHATLHLRAGADARATRERAARALDDWLDPLRGGPDGSGWPIGRTAYRDELLARLALVDGVALVSALGLNRACPAGVCCDNLVLCPNELVRPGRHRLLIHQPQSLNLSRSDPHECEHEQPCA